jgi:hypothetical protein
MSIEAKFSDFKIKYSLSDEAMNELKTLFDTLIVEVAHKIIKNEEPKKTIQKLDTSITLYTQKKFATKIAEEYAAECGITLEEIPCDTGKVTKKEIEKYVKNKPGTKSEKVSKKKESDGDEESIKPKNKSTKETNSMKEKCGGITKDGNPCNSAATKTPDGSKKCYCFRHALEWKQYEISSDSDDELELEQEPESDP